MEADEIKKQESMERLAEMCLRTLKPTAHGLYTAEIRVYSYLELASVIRNLMKLCIVALDQDAAELPSTIQSQSIDVGLIIGIALQLFPIDEFELLSEISDLYPQAKTSDENIEVA
jgi:hypothetical protein